MKRMKKLISIVMVLLLVLSTYSVSFAQNVNEKGEIIVEEPEDNVNDKNENSDQNVEEEPEDNIQNEDELTEEEGGADVSEEENIENGENYEEEVLEVEEAANENNITEDPVIEFRAHIQGIGWQGWKQSGQTIGTTGQSKRLEALQIKLKNNSGYAGDIEYSVHVQDIGWQGWKKSGETAGTTGKAKRLEAVRIRFTGELAEYYGIYYKGHVSSYGWMAMTTNGNIAGTTGLAKKVEAMQIQLVNKDVEGEPAVSGRSYLAKYGSTALQYSGHIQNLGNVKKVSEGNTLGTVGRSLRIEGLSVFLSQSSSDMAAGGVQYRTHIQGIGWTGWANTGAYSGTKGKSKRVEALQIKLTGEAAQYYNIYYRVHSQNYGWLGWAQNGETAGTSGLSYRAEAIQIKLVAKGGNAPKSNQKAYMQPVSIPKQSGSGLATFNTSKKLSGTTLNRLNNAINGYRNKGYKVGFTVIDLKTNKGIYYNSNTKFYSASTIKGPYVACLNEKVPSSASKWSGTMRNTIKVSSNSDYLTLRRNYGSAAFSTWLREAGCSDVNAVRNYTDISAKNLAQMWVKNYQFFTSGKQNAKWCSSLFTSTLNSGISKTLGRSYTVYSKAGWIGEGGYYNVQNDGGIVMKSGNPYVVVVLSNAYGRLDLMGNLVSAIDAAHSEIIR